MVSNVQGWLPSGKLIVRPAIYQAIGIDKNPNVKLLFKFLASVVILAIVVVVALIFVSDPNQYKPAIVDAFRDNTGLELNIAGDLSLSFSPFIGVSLNDVRVTNPAWPQELASSTQISMRVDALSLLRRELLIEELLANDFHVNWFTDANGVNIWSTAGSQNASTETTASSAAASRGQQATEDSGGLSTNIRLISIENASIDIQNIQQNYNYSLRGLDLISRNSNVENRPFPVEAEFDLVENSSLNRLPITFSSNNEIDLSAGNFKISEIQLSLTPMQLQGGIEIQDFNDQMSFSGELTSNTFPLQDLLKNFTETESSSEISLPGINTDQAQQMSLQMSVSGNQTGATVPDLAITVGTTEVDAEATIRFASELTPTIVSFTIESTALDLNQLLGQEAAVTQSGQDPVSQSGNVDIPPTPSATAQEMEIPRDLLVGMNVSGSVFIESLLYDQYQLDNVNIFTNLENGVLDLETQPISIFDGVVQGNMRVNSVPADSELTMQLSSQNITMADLPFPMFELEAITGRLNLEVDYSSSGKTLKDWRDNLSGTTSFSVTDNSVDIGVIKQVFTAIAALSPSGETIQQWPDVLRFQEFGGYAIFDNGIAENQEVKVRMDNFDLSGTGGINLDEGSFDYNFQFTVLGEPFLQTIPINANYHNVSWPVHCSANFDAEVSQFCRPDLTLVRELFLQMGTNAIQNRLQDVLTDQVPEELQDAARGLLRNLFQNR
jgi:AsmA protein